jgi:hypothetical protein
MFMGRFDTKCLAIFPLSNIRVCGPLEERVRSAGLEELIDGVGRTANSRKNARSVLFVRLVFFRIGHQLKWDEDDHFRKAILTFRRLSREGWRAGPLLHHSEKKA